MPLQILVDFDIIYKIRRVALHVIFSQALCANHKVIDLTISSIFLERKAACNHGISRYSLRFIALLYWNVFKARIANFFFSRRELL